MPDTVGAGGAGTGVDGGGGSGIAAPGIRSGGTAPGGPTDHLGGRCRPTLRAGSRVLRVSGPRRRAPGAVRCREPCWGLPTLYERVEGNRRVIPAGLPQSRAEEQGAQLARLDRGDVLDGADLRAARYGQQDLTAPGGFAMFMRPNPPTMVPVSAL